MNTTVDIKIVEDSGTYSLYIDNNLIAEDIADNTTTSISVDNIRKALNYNYHID